MNLVESYLESGEQKVLIFQQEIPLSMLLGSSKKLNLKDVLSYYVFLTPTYLRDKDPVILMRRYPLRAGRPITVDFPNGPSPHLNMFKFIIMAGMKSMGVWQSVRIKFYFMTERQKLLLHIWTRDFRGNSIYQNFLID